MRHVPDERLPSAPPLARAVRTICLFPIRSPSPLPTVTPHRDPKRAMGIEPTPPAWKAGALPLSYARKIDVSPSTVALPHRTPQFIAALPLSTLAIPQPLLPDRHSRLGEAGFEPAKAYATRFTVWPLWPLGYSPVIPDDQHPTLHACLDSATVSTDARERARQSVAPDTHRGASGGTRTHNLRFTKPELCH